MPISIPLGDLSVFSGVSKDRLAKLAESLAEEDYHPNELIYRTGDPCDGLYVITAGSVQLRNETPGQPIERILEMAKGEVFGEAEVVEGRPRRFTARAMEPTTLAWIPLDRVKELVAEQRIVETFLRTLAVRRQTSRARAMLAPNSRREPRIWVNREVLIQEQDGGSHRVRLVDLSLGGACLALVPGDWQVDQPLVFSLGLPDKPNLLEVRGSVRWRRDGAVGISFDLVGTGHRRRIEQALQELAPPRQEPGRLSPR